MPHMVIYRTPEGKPGYHQTEELEDAVRHVEQLRNEGQVSETRIFRMQEVQIEIKTYYRVEVQAGDVPEKVAAEKNGSAPVEVPAPEVAMEPKGQEPAAVGAPNGAGRFGLFGKN